MVTKTPPQRIELTKRQITKLLRLERAVNGNLAHLYHNILGPARVYIVFALERITDIRDRLTKKTETQKIVEQLDRITRYMNVMQIDLGTMARFSNIAGYKSESELGLEFRPMTMIKTLQRNHPGSPIRIGSRTRKSLVIAFPVDIADAIFGELIRNGLKHSKPNGEVYTTWDVKDMCFHFEIHDSGKGIVPNLGVSLLTVQEVKQILGIPEQDINGITFVDFLVSWSGGKLFYSKSNNLGGTCVSVDLPTCKYTFTQHAGTTTTHSRRFSQKLKRK